MNGDTTYGMKNSYIEAYLGDEKGIKQIVRWEKCQKKHNANFSIPAFFLTFIWYFYKGAYKAGFAFLAAFIILPNLIGFAAGYPALARGAEAVSKFNSAEPPKYTSEELFYMRNSFGGTAEEFSAYAAEAENYDRIRYEAAAVLAEFINISTLVFIIVNFILRLISASIFDYLYFRQVRYLILYEIAGIKSDSDEDIERCLALAKNDRETKNKNKLKLLITIYIVYIIAETVLRNFI